MPLPLILLGLGVAGIVGACTDDKKNENDASESNDVGSNDIGDGYASDYLDVVSDESAEQADVVSDADARVLSDYLSDKFDAVTQDVAELVEIATEIKTDLEQKDLEQTDEVETSDVKPFIPEVPTSEYVADMPCAFPSSISYSETQDAFFATCDNAFYKMFNGAVPTWQKIAEVSGFTSNHVEMDDGRFAVTYGYPDGVAIINADSKVVEDNFDFATEPVDFANIAGGFTPNSPSGAVFMDDTLCVATSNLDTPDMDQTKTTFFAGTFVCFGYLGNGQISHDSATAFATSGLNPTGMVKLDDTRFAVLSTNSYNLNAGNTSSIDVCDMPSVTCESFPLETENGGAITAQMSPTLAVTEGGNILIGVQKPSAEIIEFDPDAFEVAGRTTLPEIKGFVSSITVGDNIVMAGDFGVFGEGGKAMFFCAPECEWGTVTATMPEFPGPACFSDGKFYITASSSDMTSAALYSFDAQNFKEVQ